MQALTKKEKEAVIKYFETNKALNQSEYKQLRNARKKAKTILIEYENAKKLLIKFAEGRK